MEQGVKYKDNTILQQGDYKSHHSVTHLSLGLCSLSGLSLSPLGTPGGRPPQTRSESCS